MNIRVRFVQVGGLADLDDLRRAYLDRLCAAQEPLLEVRMPQANHYLIHAKNGVCGYFSVDSEGTLIELHLRKTYQVFGEVIVRQILAHLPVKRALVKSFDHLMLSSCITYHTRLRSLGLLVRDYVPRPLPEMPSIRFETRQATLEDLPRIHAVDQDVFTVPERLRHVVETGCTWLFETSDTLIGFGILRPVVPGRPDVDVGIAVDRPFRSRGHAVYILRDLVERCRARGLNPIAGCAADNPASRHMGERIGFVANHRLLELRFD